MRRRLHVIGNTSIVPGIAASAREEREKIVAGVRPQAEKLLAQRKPVTAELRMVTAMMRRAGVPRLAGTDTSFLHPPGFTLHTSWRRSSQRA